MNTALDPAVPASAVNRPVEGRATARWKQIAVALALVAGAIYFIARGPVRAVQGGSVDFRYYFYVAQRTFAQGGNPYRMHDLLATAAGVSEGHRQFLQAVDNPVIIYPPSFFVIAPMGLLPVKLAVWLWILAQCIAFAALLRWASQFAATAWTPCQRGLFVACGLCLAPVHTGIAGGSTGPLFTSLAVALFLSLQKNSTGWAGLILGLLMIKPTFGIPAAVVASILARWRVLALGFAVWWLTSLPMFWRFGIRESLSGFLNSVLLQAAPGGPANETLQNPAHYSLLNLRAWWHSILGPVYAEVSTVVVLMLMLYALLRFRRQSHAAGSAPYWTLAGCFICLATYHRSYDAAIVAVPLAAAFDLYRLGGPYFWTWVTALVPFAVPGGTFLHLKLGVLSHRFPLLELLLVRHQTVALIILATLAVVGLRRLSGLARVSETVKLEV